MKNIKLWDWVVQNQRLKKNNNNKKTKTIFFSRYNIKVKYYWLFCIIKIFFSRYNVKVKYYWVFYIIIRKIFSRSNIKVKYYWVFYIIVKKIYFFSRHNIKFLEITIDNYYKLNLETIIDRNNSQYFWINRRDLEIESRSN